MRMNRPWLVDGAVAAVLLAVSVAFTAAAGRAVGHPIWLGFGLITVAAVALAARRRWPLPVLGVVTVATAGYLVLGYPYGPIMVVFLIAVYTVARHIRLARSVPAAAVALILLCTHLFFNPAALPGFTGVIPASAWVVVPFAVGVVLRLVREQGDAARADALRRHADEERLRVAREVHDVVGHGLAAIKMQANIALHVLDRDPGHAESALTAIANTSTAALDDLRATLAVVRGREPTPGLDRVGELCDRMAESGVAVELTTSGEPRPVPAAVDFAAYRVVQESLTNVLKHAHTRTATVHIGYQPAALAITVGNPAPAAPAAIPGGLGIPGMRERVTALGGTFTAGHGGDRFTVTAVLPTEGSTP